MTTNGEWLEYLANNAPDELAAWFDSEHVETANGTLDGDTAALNAKIAELTADNDRLAKLLSKSLEEYSILEAERDEAMEAYDAHIAAHDSWHEAEEITYTRNRFSVLEQAKNERIAKLTAERDNLADDLLIANKQREWYREKFGKCLDYADAIHALMDDRGLA